MAGKAKSVYLSIVEIGKPLSAVVRKQFFNAKEANDYIKTVEEQYPKEQYQYVKEVY